MDVAWFEDVPVVCQVETMADGERSVVVYGDKESLKLMWAEIQRLTALIDGNGDHGR